MRKLFTGTFFAVFILLLAIAGIAASLLTLYRVGQLESWDTQYTQLALDSSATAEAIATLGDDITRGLPPNTVELEGLRENFEFNIDALRNGDSFIDLPPIPEPLQAGVEALDTEFQPMSSAVERILSNRAAYVLIQQEAARIRDTIPAVSDALETATVASAARRAPAEQLALLTELRVGVQSLDDLADDVATRGFDAAALAETLATETESISIGLQQLISGEGLSFTRSRSRDIDAALVSALEVFDRIPLAVEAITIQAADLAVVQDAAAEISRLRNNVKFTAENNLQQSILTAASERILNPLIGYILGGAALFLLVVFVVVLVGSARRRTRQLEESDAAQQEAILRLLDEISTLADGDLTVDVTVAEDFTGAIADSINYTVETLRDLVGTISDTSQQIAQSTGTSADLAEKMRADSETQASEIQNVARAIQAMSESMQAVSQRAETMTDEAKRSVDVAHSGSETVREAVAGMTTLREQIQETSKRIKRLGESSQEIGNIIEFINDIADQTNTLALNASIQAAMAGDAGKGFAVVAEEVQRLAERAAGATRQIETLVKTIQADTNEAIVSMERSTTTVVGNAALSERAGTALDSIESTSNQLSELMGTIFDDARAQSESATQLAGTMSSIEDIARKTQTSAGSTASAVGQLDGLSVKLRESVSGFVLPGSAVIADQSAHEETLILGDSGELTMDDETRDAA